ncbi:mechanosensitive ion channel family protein [Puniceicoccus vermicola]|uniref:Mechanosensitive ion channel n=1 Tax=Puniceicoccus vermicola TaxID=388746 RepID=A0A7X1AVM2_9BACT|nr:mechanosensitive ion channel domain-containing protein [Puniceicoccus vermicola]MBC2600662.1 mechanosensitive ion channel [Puniceicoccus vermicola]
MEKIDDFLYFAAVIAAGMGGWFLLTTILTRTERKRAARIQRLKRFEPLRSEAPQKNHTEDSRDQALESLGYRFSIIRRTLLSVLVLVWLGLASAPFLDGFSTGLISVFGAAGAVLVGIAARPFLENVIAGYVVTFSKQFRTGDTILLDEQYGTIEDITPTHTIIKLWDWRRYVVPNSSMLTKEVINYSNRENLIWAKIQFYVSYQSDMKLVREVAIQAGRKSHLLVGDDDPKFWIMEMEKESIQCWLAMWTHTPADAWNLKVEVAGRIIEELAARGIRTHSYELHTSPGARTS